MNSYFTPAGGVTSLLAFSQGQTSETVADYQ